MEEYRCVVCNSTFDRQNKLDIHMITKKHIMTECKNANIEQMKERYCTVKKDKLESDRMVRKLQIDIKTIKEENIHIQKESARKLKEESIRIRDESAKKIKEARDEGEKKLKEETSKIREESKKLKEDMEKRMKQLENMLITTKKSPTSIKISNSQIEGDVINGNKVSINVQINDRGRENWAYISNIELAKLMKATNAFPEEMVKRLHFDKDHPENHNVLMKNQRQNQLMVRDNNSWKIVDKDNEILSMIISAIDRAEIEAEESGCYERIATENDKKRWQDLKDTIGVDKKSSNENKKKQIQKKVVNTIITEQKQIFNKKPKI